MNYLLDTSAFSDLMREHVRMDARLEALARDDRVQICSIVRGEILYGLRRLPDGQRREALEAKAALLFAEFSCAPVPASAGDHYARVKRDCQREGLSLDENDLWIAATALASNAVLVSRDRDFQRIESLPVQDWTI